MEEVFICFRDTTPGRDMDCKEARGHNGGKPLRNSEKVGSREETKIHLLTR